MQHIFNTRGVRRWVQEQLASRAAHLQQPPGLSAIHSRNNHTFFPQKATHGSGTHSSRSSKGHTRPSFTFLQFRKRPHTAQELIPLQPHTALVPRIGSSTNIPGHRLRVLLKLITKLHRADLQARKKLSSYRVRINVFIGIQ